MKRARRPEAAAAASAPAASSGAGGNAQKKARHGDGGVRRSGPTGLTTRQLDALELPDQLSQFLDVAGLNKHSTPLPPELVTYMRGLLRDHPEIRMVCQVGLHNGMLVELLLAERSDISVVTVDAAHYPEVAAAAQHYFDRKFPLRHMLVMGDSRMGVPMVAQVVGAHKFDLIILGGTSVQEEAERDLRSARILAHRDTLVMRNGIVRYKADGIGPCSAWTVVVKLGEVQELEFHHTPTFEHAWGVGRYCDRPASEGAMQEKKTMAESFWDNNRVCALLLLRACCRRGTDARGADRPRCCGSLGCAWTSTVARARMHSKCGVRCWRPASSPTRGRTTRA